MLETSETEQGRNFWNRGEGRLTVGWANSVFFVLSWAARRRRGVRSLKINVTLKARSIDL